MIIKNAPIDSVHLYPENPREIDKSQFEKLKKSLTEFGFVAPLVVNLRHDDSFKPEEKKPTLVGGNMRWRAAKELGLKEVPIVEINLNRNKEAMLNIGLNRITGKWDISKLEKLVYDLSNTDLELDLDLTGLEDWEMKLYNPAEDVDTEEIEKIIGTDEKPSFILKIVFPSEEDFVRASRGLGGDKRVRKIIRGEKVLKILDVYEKATA